jgi:hypothetical protein
MPKGDEAETSPPQDRKSGAAGHTKKNSGECFQAPHSEPTRDFGNSIIGCQVSCGLEKNDGLSYVK